MRTAQECELVANIEIEEQARVYERVIASMEKEIAALHQGIAALNEDIAFYTGKLQPDDREYV